MSFVSGGSCSVFLVFTCGIILVPTLMISERSPDKLSLDDLLYLVTVLFGSYLLYRISHLCFVPTNRIKGLDAFGPVRADSLKNLGRMRSRQANQVRQRQKENNMPPPYPNSWFAVMKSRHLQVAQVKPLNVLGLQLVIFRDASGDVHILDGICPHLGASLSHGTVKQDGLECPFHKWVFDGSSGDVTCVPYSIQNKDSLGRFGVDSWPVFEANGSVHLWHHAEGEPPTWYPPQHPRIADRSFRYRGRTQHTIAAHIQDLPENGADPAHLPAIHEKIFTAGNSLDVSVLWSWISHSWEAGWEEHPDRKHEALLKMSTNFTLFNRYHFYRNQVQINQVGPGLVYMNFSSPLGDGVVIQMVTPTAPLQQHVVHEVYWHRSYGLGSIIAKFYLLAESTQFERDIRIWNNKDHLVRPCLVREDSLIMKYRRWFSQFYSENSRRPYHPIDNMDI